MLSDFWKNHILVWLPVYIEMEKKYGITPSVFFGKLLNNKGCPDVIDIERLYVCIMLVKEEYSQWYEEVKVLIPSIFKIQGSPNASRT